MLKSNLLVARFGELVGSPDFLVHEEAVRFFANMAIEGRMDYSKLLPITTAGAVDAICNAGDAEMLWVPAEAIARILSCDILI